MFLHLSLLLILPILSICSPIKTSENLDSVWLLEHQNEEITAVELAKKFGVPEVNKSFIFKKGTNEKGKMLLKGEKPKEFAFNHELTRDKFLPMASAAYGTDENIQQCLKKTFENGQLHRHVKIPCNGHNNQICAGFLAISHSDKAIILSFRGTSSFMQLTMETSRILFISQANATLGGKVASYFSEIFVQLMEKGIIEDALKLIKVNPGYELWITGHSLGGALASLAAAEIYLSKSIEADKIKLITFGQPRTGNSEWATAMSRALPYYNYRIINQRDVVAHIPLRRFQNYQHFTTEVWYKNEMEKGEFVQCDEMDEDDQNCSNSLWTFSVVNHDYYYGHKVNVYGKNGCEDI